MLNRLGDILYDNNSVPMTELNEFAQKDRATAAECYEKALIANQTVIAKNPADYLTFSNLAVTHQRIGIVFRDKSAASDGPGAVTLAKTALSHFEAAAANHIKGKKINAAASPDTPVSAWWDANLAYDLGGSARAYDDLVHLTADSGEKATLRGESRAKRVAARDRFLQAIETAEKGVGQVTTETKNSKYWQGQADELSTLIAESDRALNGQ